LDLSSGTEWNSDTGRLHAAYEEVGHQPFTIGVILFAIGLLVIVVSLLARKSAPMPSEAGSEIRPPADDCPNTPLQPTSYAAGEEARL
jgi:hypothetical protein